MQTLTFRPVNTSHVTWCEHGERVQNTNWQVWTQIGNYARPQNIWTCANVNLHKNIFGPPQIYLQKHHVLLVFQLSSSSPAVKASLHSATVKDPTSNFSKFPTTSLVSHIFQPRLLLLVFSSYVSCISQIFLPRLQWPTSRNLWKIKSSCTHVCNLLWVIFCPFLILCILMRAIKDVPKDK